MFDPAGDPPAMLGTGQILGILISSIIIASVCGICTYPHERVCWKKAAATIPSPTGATVIVTAHP